MKTFKADKIKIYTESDLKKKIAEALEAERAKYRAALAAVDEEFEKFNDKQAEITNDAEELVFLMCYVALWRGFGFGRKRIDRFCDQVEELKEMMSDGKITWFDIRARADKLGYGLHNMSGMVQEMPEDYEITLL